MKTRIATLLAAMMVLSMVAVPATADPFAEPHPHFLLVGADVDLTTPDPATGAPYTINSYEKCVPLAGGKAQTHNRFHHLIHWGQANQALVGAGHIVVPFGCP